MTVQRMLRSVVLIAVVLVALPAAAARPAERMPIGFYDDPSFRWSSQDAANLAGARSAHASVVHALVNWATTAPTKPAHPLNGSDPAYHLADIDALVSAAEKYDMQVLLTITGTPGWANGGQTQNHPPTNLNDLTEFAEMLAARYSGRHPGLGIVTRFSIWNEPNLGLFLVPQFVGTKIVSPAIYARLFMAAYKGIKAGNPNAVVAAGETSNRGRNHPTGSPGQDSVAPGTFAQLLAQAAPTLPFTAWATHPYPSNFPLGPAQKVAFPNVAFSTMTEFGQSLAKWFHRTVPIWVTEYGEETKPEFVYGVSYSQEASDAQKALQLAAANPYVQMFVWFIFRDSNGQTWFSGLEKANGQKKPAFATFATTASGIVGQTIPVRPNAHFKISVAVPFMLSFDPPGTEIGIKYTIKSKSQVLGAGEAREPLQSNEDVTFPVAFNPAKGVSYTMTVSVNDIHGQTEQHVIALIPVT